LLHTRASHPSWFDQPNKGLLEKHAAVSMYGIFLIFYGKEVRYEGLSKSFRIESITKQTTPNNTQQQQQQQQQQQTLVEKQHKGLWRQNSLY
jgi:hypothetical protein